VTDVGVFVDRSSQLVTTVSPGQPRIVVFEILVLPAPDATCGGDLRVNTAKDGLPSEARSRMHASEGWYRYGVMTKVGTSVSSASLRDHALGTRP